MYEKHADSANRSDRSVLLAAAISGTLYTLGAFVPQVDGPPVETATAGQIRAFLVAHDTGLRIVATAGALAIPLVLVFTVSLARLMRSRQPSSPLADLVIGGGVLIAIWHWLVIAGTCSTLVQTLDGTDLATVDDATLKGWYGLTNFTHLLADLGMPAIASVMAATSIIVLRTGLFARWVGWLGVILAVGGAIGTIGITTASKPLAAAWFVGIFGWWLWTLIVSITCALRLRQRTHSSASEPRRR